MPEANTVQQGSPVETPAVGDPKTPAVKTEGPIVKMVEVEIGGVKAQVPESFVKQYQDLQSGVTSLRNEVEALKKPAASVIETDAADPFANIDTELFADPKAAVMKILAIARAEATQAAGAVKTEVAARQSQTEFWNEFYKVHTHLDRETDGDVVSAVMSREYDSMKGLKVPEAIASLGDKATAAILRIATKRGGKMEPKPLAEGGNEPSKKGSKEDSTEVSPNSGGLSGVIKARQAARRAAAKV